MTNDALYFETFHTAQSIQAEPNPGFAARYLLGPSVRCLFKITLVPVRVPAISLSIISWPLMVAGMVEKHIAAMRGCVLISAPRSPHPIAFT